MSTLVILAIALVGALILVGVGALSGAIGAAVLIDRIFLDTPGDTDTYGSTKARRQ